MSHSSGILVSAELKQHFSQSAFRALFVRISSGNDELEVIGNVAMDDAERPQWTDSDFNCVTETITSKTDPCFCIFKLDSQQYLLISYIPDDAAVKHKMLYSSTKSTMTKQLGDSQFVQQYHANNLEELSLDNYKAYLQHLNGPKDHLLSAREVEMQQIKLNETNSGVSISTKQSFNNGISLQIENEDLLKTFSNGYLMFSILSGTETFVIKEYTSAEDLVNAIPKDSPRFSLISLKGKILFLYTCPGSSRIRDRMLYSASRANLLASISQTVVVDIKTEISDMDELSMEMLEAECDMGSTAVAQSPSPQSNKGFIKKGVRGPGSGARRLHRQPSQQT